MVKKIVTNTEPVVINQTIRETPLEDLSIAELQALANAGVKPTPQSLVNKTTASSALREAANKAREDVQAEEDTYFNHIEERSEAENIAAREELQASQDAHFNGLGDYDMAPDISERINRALDNVVLPADLLNELSIDTFDLETEMTEQAQRFAHYALLHAQAAADYEEFKDSIGLVVAALDDVVRQEFNGKGEKVTEAKVEATIKSHVQYVDAVANKIEANRQMQIASAIKEAFLMRAQMLTMIVSSRNKEMSMS